MVPTRDGPDASTTEEERSGSAMKSGLLSLLGCTGMLRVLGGVGVASVREVAYRP